MNYQHMLNRGNAGLSHFLLSFLVVYVLAVFVDNFAVTRVHHKCVTHSLITLNSIPFVLKDAALIKRKLNDFLQVFALID
jgi:hypothetical protein